MDQLAVMTQQRRHVRELERRFQQQRRIQQQKRQAKANGKRSAFSADGGAR